MGHDRLGCFDMQVPCAGHLGLGSVPRTEEALPLQRGQEQSPLHDPGPQAGSGCWQVAGSQGGGRWRAGAAQGSVPGGRSGAWEGRVEAPEHGFPTPIPREKGSGGGPIKLPHLTVFVYSGPPLQTRRK